MALPSPARPAARALLAPALALLLFALALAGCSRDLDVPAARSFSASASRETVAPRETVTLAASGGKAPYAWSFADGGRLSGDDATVEPAGEQATYRAGSSGSAQDVVELRDATGATARARITVTAPLSITPASAIVAPGGVQTLQVSGGKKPYRFSFVTDPSPSAPAAIPPASGSDASLFVPAAGTSADYGAGSKGDVYDYVAVTDSVVPVVTVVVAVRVTSPLQIFPRAITAAPNEIVAFTAFGGQPPYVYSPSGSSGGRMLDDTAGVYQVGPFGYPAQDPRGVDTITVGDGNNRIAVATITVTPPLAAALASADVRGGTPIQILVSGGKAPYEFGFAPLGDRSHGTVDRFGGLYTPGPSPGASDVLSVTDATGTTVTVTAPAVGPLRLATGGGVARCVTGDFDGNRVSDVAFLHEQMKLTQYTGIGTSTERARTYYVGTDSLFPPTWVGDPDADGRSEINLLGARSGGPYDPMALGPAGYWWLDPASDGALVTAALSSGQSARTGVHLPLPGAPSVLLATRCGVGPGSGLNWLQHVSPGTAQATACAQVEVPGELPQGGATRISALAAPDLDGDAAGAPDLAWLVAASTSEDSPGPVYVRYGALTGGPQPPVAFVAPPGATSVPLPPGTFFQGQGDGEQRRLVTLPANRGGFPSGLLVRLADVASYRGSLWILAAPSRPGTFDPVGVPTWTRLPDLLPPGGSGYDGALLLPTRIEGIQDVVAWSVDGDYASFQILANHALMEGSGSRFVGQAGFPVSGACAADVTGDGAADLVLAGASMTTADVVFGADGVAFGTRPHFRGMSWPAALGDFDGDGIGDVVAAEDGLGLSILYGTEDQLAWSERISSGPASLVAAGPFVAGARGDSVIFRKTAGGFALVPNGAAGFAAPEPLPAARPDGSAVTANLVPLLVNAPLGGPDPGPDLLAFESSLGQVWAHVLWRENGRLVDLRSALIGAAGAGGQKVSDCWFLPVGQETGQGAWGADEPHAGVAVAGVCTFVDPSDPTSTASIVRWVGATIVGSGASLRLSSWTVSAPLVGPAGVESRVAALGTIGGRALFATRSGPPPGPYDPALASTSFAIVALGGPGAAANPATWGTAVPQAPVTFLPFTAWSPMLGAVGDLDGDGRTDAVVTTKEGRLLVLRNTGTDASPVLGVWPGTARGLGGGGIPLGVRPSRWNVPPLPGQPGILDKPSVMTFVGDFDNLGVAPEIVPFVNQVNAANGQVLR